VADESWALKKLAATFHDFSLLSSLPEIAWGSGAAFTTGLGSTGAFAFFERLRLKLKNALTLVKAVIIVMKNNIERNSGILEASSN
jgi:hypothetical protein